MSEIKTTDDLAIFLNEFDSKIKGFMHSLKKQSSDEILNGSAQKAQELLNKIIKIEDGVKRVNSSHEYLLSLINNKKSVNVAPKVIKNEIQETIIEDNFEEVNHKEEKKSITKYRMPLLKALIYLGGTANEEDVLEFVHKEIKKVLSDEELSVNGDGKTKIWIRDLRKDSQSMVSEGLINKDEDENSFEITQKGIDYLAKNDE